MGLHRAHLSRARAILGMAWHKPLPPVGWQASPAAPTGEWMLKSWRRRCLSARLDHLLQHLQGSGTSLERALIHPEKLRNPKVFTVPHSSPARPISSSFLQKAYSKDYDLLHMCSTSLQDPREQCGCTSFPISEINRHLSIPYKRRKKILGDL